MIRYYRASDAFKSFEELNNYSINGKGKLKITFEMLKEQAIKVPSEPYQIFVTVNRCMKFEALKEIFKVI